MLSFSLCLFLRFTLFLPCVVQMSPSLDQLLSFSLVVNLDATNVDLAEISQVESR